MEFGKKRSYISKGQGFARRAYVKQFIEDPIISEGLP
jgi:hypothetical protein